LQQRPCVAIHSIHGVAMHRRKRRLLIAFEELTDTDNDIQGCPQFMTDRFHEISIVEVGTKKGFMNRCLLLWDIDWLHSSYSQHEFTR